MLSVQRARVRVIIDNDYSGDPDGLFQLAHHLLSPSVHISLIVGSHLSVDDPFDPSAVQADTAATMARVVTELAGREDVPVIAGSNTALAAADGGPSDAARAIVEEALRVDARPLFYCAGAGLTDLAMALEIEPSIAERMTLIWIGGADYPSLTGNGEEYDGPEFNFGIDPDAARRVFDVSALTIWQVPRGTYLQAVVSFDELNRITPSRLSTYLLHALGRIGAMFDPTFPLGETFTLGDQPLVLLTALTSAFGRTTTSSRSVSIARRRLEADGNYAEEVPGRTTVFTTLDTRLMLGDLFAKLERHAAR